MAELTSSLLTKMRQARTITFHMTQDLEGHRTSEIRLHPEDLGDSSHITVECGTSFVDYGEPLRVHYKLSGYHHAGTPSVTPHLRTLLWEVLRADDVLTLRWVRGNNNDNNRSVRWQTDDLYLVVTRRKARLTFLLARQTGPDNTARMIREIYVTFEQRCSA